MNGTWPLALSVVVFVVAAVVIGVAGTRLVRLVDRLADRTGLGEAFFGMALLGGITSLSGSVLSVTAALDGLPQLAVSNAVGGIAVQTLFLVVADATYRGVNLEHAAPSLPNLMSAGTLMLLLALSLAAPFGPEVTVWSIHPVSPLIIVGYLVGLHLLRDAQEHPWWRASRSPETREDDPDGESEEDGEEAREGTASLWIKVLVLGAITGVAGFALARAGSSIAAETPLSTTVIGALFTATTTSLPELVTTVAAVRRGALTLAIGGIVGGNSFDVMMLPVTDVAYRPGSLYHAIGPDQLLVIAMTLAMTAVLLLGLLTRQRRGFFNIGGEGLALIALYVVTLAIVAVE